MPYLIGAALALAVGLSATLARFDRDRAFYPTITIVVASYYPLFAVMAAPTSVRLVESLIVLPFLVASVLGFKRSLWIVVGARCGHGIRDSFHGRLVVNPGVPTWWPGFCLAYDLVAGGYLAVLLSLKRTS